MLAAHGKMMLSQGGRAIHTSVMPPSAITKRQKMGKRDRAAWIKTHS